MGSLLQEEGGGESGAGGGLFPSTAKPQAGYLLEGRVLITTTWAGLQDGFIKTAPFHTKALLPQKSPGSTKALIFPGLP